MEANSAIPPDTVKTASFHVAGGSAEPRSTVAPVTARATPFGFGLSAFDGLTSSGADGVPSTKAGAHPYDSSVSFDLNTVANPAAFAGDLWPVEPLKDAFAELPPGLIGNPTVATQCTTDQLANVGGGALPICAPSSQVGTSTIRINGNALPADSYGPLPVFSMVPPTGVPARFGFNVLGTMVLLDAKLRSDGDYGFTIIDHNVPEGLPIAGTTVSLWGTPASPLHQPERSCEGQEPPSFGGPSCPSGLTERPFLRNPTSCTGAESLRTTMTVDSWFDPGRLTPGRTGPLRSGLGPALIHSHAPPGYPYPPKEWGEALGTDECKFVPVKGNLSATPSALDAETPTGLAVNLEIRTQAWKTKPASPPPTSRRSGSLCRRA